MKQRHEYVDQYGRHYWRRPAQVLTQRVHLCTCEQTARPCERVRCRAYYVCMSCRQYALTGDE